MCRCAPTAMSAQSLRVTWHGACGTRFHPVMKPTMFAVFFLTPWTALATAALAASIPVIIHLLNRKRFRVVPWAAMRFLLAAQKRTVRKLRVEQWLLLAIRTLLILLLIL